MKLQEEEAKTPDHSKINQKKPKISLTCLYANNPCLIQVHQIKKYSISLNPNPPNNPYTVLPEKYTELLVSNYQPNNSDVFSLLFP